MNYKQFVIVAFILASLACNAQTVIGPGDEPQMAKDLQNVIRIVYGNKDLVYYSFSNDHGETFSDPKEIAQIPGMHLGMSRGPQIASSKDYSLVTAMDKKGNIHAFRLNHKSNQWDTIGNINDIEGSAPEGLMSIAADASNNFYAVWLDLREDHQNNICFSILKDGSQWSKNKFIYKSPDGHVCECCKPSIVASEGRITIMFRNWLTGSRDLYLITSADRGNNFGESEKLGKETWKLNGCPMDGGGLAINSDHITRTAWQREGKVFYCEPGKSEEEIAEGRAVGITDGTVYWEQGTSLFVQRKKFDVQKIADGTAMSLLEIGNNKVIAVWSNEMKVIVKTL